MAIILLNIINDFNSFIVSKVNMICTTIRTVYTIGKQLYFIIVLYFN